MTRILELSGRKFKKAMVNTLRVLAEKINNIQEQIYNTRRRKLQERLKRRCWKSKNIVTEIKNASNELLRKRDTAKKRISELDIQ